MNSNTWRRAVREMAEKFGCTVEVTGGSHYMLKHPDGWRVYTSQSPSDFRALRYLKTDLKKKATGVWK